MAIQVALAHRTHYRYDRLVKLSSQIIRLRPSAHCPSDIKAYSLKVTPKNHFLYWTQDLYGNFQANIVIPEATSEFCIEVDLITTLKPINPLDFFLEEQYQVYPFIYSNDLQTALYPYLQAVPHAKQISAFAKNWHKPNKTIGLISQINAAVAKYFNYVIRLEHGVQTPDETFKKGSGSCRDLAWLLIAVLRQHGFAARFVSGYLIQLKSNEQPLADRPTVTEDTTDLHAWAEIYLPGAGWIGLDPTSGLFAGEGHIPLCASPNPSHAAPVEGRLETCFAEMAFSIQMTRLIEPPTPNKPYLPNEWDAIYKFGLQVDKTLQQQNVRLMMGGEPTFVSARNTDAPEWQTASLGEEKWRLAHALRKQLIPFYAPFGVTRTGQGKWYSGEPLPRFSLDYFWRVDQEPIFIAQHLLAAVLEKPKQKAKTASARDLLAYIAKALCVNAEHIIPAHGTKGFVLPLGKSARTNTWVSQRWPVPAQGLQPIIGDSALGYRLPLNAIPFSGYLEEIKQPRDSFDSLSALPTYQSYKERCQENIKQCKKSNEAQGDVRLALCVEIRQNIYYIFLPPVAQLEDYLELITAIELAAVKSEIAIVLEGYQPPTDPRLQKLSITPDPGVIEVNVPPVSCWSDLVEQSNHLYTAAKACDLQAHKFLMDGREVGTGGGNHITLGGYCAADSPLLRRPDVLRSLITFFQHHPSLSYVFSGQYVGPTSQAPRIDEARHDTLYELEIACAELIATQQENTISPWLCDRLLRHLLTDMTGNTHRSEFCIDKLYAPRGESGRQGLLELRAFEMPAHEQLYAAELLLVRTLIAYFWQYPYHHSFIRFGTELHDRYLLPHFLWQDFLQVIQQLNLAGFELAANWFKPFFNFRFPPVGEVQIESIHLELRMALEPWHVLGEENISGQTSRTVDSAIERLQVKLTGLPKNRYSLTCQGYEVPLQSTGRHGEFVAGIRFKAWAPIYTLHPQLPIQSPLVFDLIDLHLQRAIGGCTYYSAHPGGRNYNAIPINREEAASRMHARFFPFGHTPGEVQIAPLSAANEFPYTLDLRRQVEFTQKSQGKSRTKIKKGNIANIA